MYCISGNSNFIWDIIMGKMKQLAMDLEDAENAANYAKPTPDHDRFDFEQELIRFANIIDDLKQVNRGVNGINNRQIDHMINYYNDRFDIVWNLFEEMVHTGQIK